MIGGRNQARLGEIHDVLALPGVAAWSDDGLVGVATYRIDGEGPNCTWAASTVLAR